MVCFHKASANCTCTKVDKLDAFFNLTFIWPKEPHWDQYSHMSVPVNNYYSGSSKMSEKEKIASMKNSCFIKSWFSTFSTDFVRQSPPWWPKGGSPALLPAVDQEFLLLALSIGCLVESIPNDICSISICQLEAELRRLTLVYGCCWGFSPVPASRLP